MVSRRRAHVRGSPSTWSTWGSGALGKWLQVTDAWSSSGLDHDSVARHTALLFTDDTSPCYALRLLGKYSALGQFLRYDNGGIMKRRMLLIGMAVAPLTIALARSGHVAERAGATMSVEELQKNWKMYLAESADVALTTEPLKRSDAEWKQ